MPSIASLFICKILWRWLNFKHNFLIILVDINCKARVETCTSLHSHECISPYLDRLTTCEKRDIYKHIKRSRQLLSKGQQIKAQTKMHHHQRKILVNFRRDWVGVVQFELQLVHVTIRTDIICQQLEHLKIDLKDKRFSLINIQDNAQI